MYQSEIGEMFSLKLRETIENKLRKLMITLIENNIN